MINEDGLVLGAVITGRAANEGTKSAVYKITKMQAAQILFEQDRLAAFKLAGINPNVGNPIQSRAFVEDMTSREFLERYSKTLDDEIKGQKFGDMFLRQSCEGGCCRGRSVFHRWYVSRRATCCQRRDLTRY